jgi:[acyl-carrier-protein] S-malonyltransferase
VTELAAWVGDRPIPVADIEERLAVMRAGPYASRLPHPATAAGRNLRRWLVQAVTTEAVVEHEASLRRITADDGVPQPVTLAAALRTGGVTAAILATCPLARALRDQVTAHVTVAEPTVLDYYHRNRDRYSGPLEDARPTVEEVLSTAERERYFTQWLDERSAALVRLLPGFEHPGDPRQPDYTHQH